MEDVRKEIIKYLESLKTNREEILLNKDLSKTRSVAYGYGVEITSLNRVIDIIKEDLERGINN